MTTKVYGHEDKIKPLAHELPPVTLFIGPPSVGKRTSCEYLLAAHGFRPSDTLPLDRLLMADAQAVLRFVSTRPMGKRKAVSASLDGASPEALNALLKCLEEPPAYATFLLRSTQPTLLTVQSRAAVVRLGYLQDAAMSDLLMDQFGFSPEDAAHATRVGGGQVRKALNFKATAHAKSPVLSALRAVSTKDEALLSNSLVAFEDPETCDARVQLLRQWTEEAISGHWRVFQPEEQFGLPKECVRQIASALRTHARPRLAARLALWGAVSA